MYSYANTLLICIYMGLCASVLQRLFSHWYQADVVQYCLSFHHKAPSVYTQFPSCASILSRTSNHTLHHSILLSFIPETPEKKWCVNLSEENLIFPQEWIYIMASCGNFWFELHLSYDLMLVLLQRVHSHGAWRARSTWDFSGRQIRNNYLTFLPYRHHIWS